GRGVARAVPPQWLRLADAREATVVAGDGQERRAGPGRDDRLRRAGNAGGHRPLVARASALAGAGPALHHVLRGTGRAVPVDLRGSAGGRRDAGGDRGGGRALRAARADRVPVPRGVAHTSGSAPRDPAEAAGGACGPGRMGTRAVHGGDGRGGAAAPRAGGAATGSV